MSAARTRRQKTPVTFKQLGLILLVLFVPVVFFVAGALVLSNLQAGQNGRKNLGIALLVIGGLLLVFVTLPVVVLMGR